jgi:hypothetical protein
VAAADRWAYMSCESRAGHNVAGTRSRAAVLTDVELFGVGVDNKRGVHRGLARWLKPFRTPTTRLITLFYVVFFLHHLPKDATRALNFFLTVQPLFGVNASAKGADRNLPGISPPVATCILPGSSQPLYEPSASRADSPVGYIRDVRQS